METTKQTIIFKVTYYNQGKLNIKKTIVSHAGFYWKTIAVPYLSELGDKIDYFFRYNKWPSN